MQKISKGKLNLKVMKIYIHTNAKIKSVWFQASNFTFCGKNSLVIKLRISRKKCKNEIFNGI